MKKSDIKQLIRESLSEIYQKRGESTRDFHVRGFKVKSPEHAWDYLLIHYQSKLKLIPKSKRVYGMTKRHNLYGQEVFDLLNLGTVPPTLKEAGEILDQELGMGHYKMAGEWNKILDKAYNS